MQDIPDFRVDEEMANFKRRQRLKEGIRVKLINPPIFKTFREAWNFSRGYLVRKIEKVSNGYAVTEVAI
jgi:hypothetical protein